MVEKPYNKRQELIGKNVEVCSAGSLEMAKLLTPPNTCHSKGVLLHGCQDGLWNYCKLIHLLHKKYSMVTPGSHLTKKVCSQLK